MYIYIYIYNSSILDIKHPPYCTWFATNLQGDLETINSGIYTRLCVSILYIYICDRMYVCICVFPPYMYICVCVCMCVFVF